MSYYSAHSKIYHIKADSLDNLPKFNPTKKTVPSNHSIINNKRTELKHVLNNKMTTDLSSSNSLSGLLAHYDSDSEHEDNNEESTKLDSKVDDFLQEINQIVPKNIQQNNATKEPPKVPVCAWQECFDKSTGYPYYWNVHTNAVTWDVPEEYKQWLAQTKILEINSKLTTQNVSPKVQIIPTEIKNNQKPTTVIQTEIPPKDNKQTKINKSKKQNKPKTTRKLSSDSEDEKIVLITSFSGGSSSESETDQDNKTAINKVENESNAQTVVMGPQIEDAQTVKESSLPIKESPEIIVNNNKKEIVERIKESVDETVILARLRTQAKVMHEIGELPPSLDKSDSNIKIKTQSLALVAGYGADSDQEEEEEQPEVLLQQKILFPIPSTEPVEILTNDTTTSTLFPATKPIDVKQFELPNEKTLPTTFPPPIKDSQTDILDNKLFKRKKRLNIAFEKRLKPNEQEIELPTTDENERKGLGFQSSTISNNTDEEKSAFMKGGIAFIKADTLNPIPEKVDTKEESLEDFHEVKDVVTEKVYFLAEGKDSVSAVQIMAIQLQTLEAAYKASALSKKYLYTWLRETFTDLEKLEQEATPEGWKCQWDRSNKRYFYCNITSGETQWEYPVPDIVGGGEAMDICTTPPPDEETQQVTAAKTGNTNTSEAAGKDENCKEEKGKSVKEGSSAPPSPPVITNEKTVNKDEVQPPIPSTSPPLEVVPPPPHAVITENQPLPPGVDSSDLSIFGSKSKEKEATAGNKIPKNVDALGSELDSFYSDIAMLEAATGSGTEKNETESVKSPASLPDGTNEGFAKKKKKSKSKIGQGINMKKKAVSSLVEKWKKVQNDYL